MADERKRCLKVLDDPVVRSCQFTILLLRQRNINAVVDPDLCSKRDLVSSVEQWNVRVENRAVRVDQPPKRVGSSSCDALLTLSLG